MKEDHAFYAGIHDPRELRRDLLTCQKNIIDSLKKYEQLGAIRAEKEMHLLELKKRMGSLRLIMSKLKSVLPAAPIKRAPEVKQAPASGPAKKEVQQRKTQLQVLEDELSRIESKLSSLE